MTAPLLVRRWPLLLACGVAGGLAVPLDSVATPVAGAVAGLLGGLGLFVWQWSRLARLVVGDAPGGYRRLVQPAVWMGIGVVVGLLLRWTAILTLGRFFTADVAIHEGQRVVSAGPYRNVRHPSCTGLMLAFLGLGVFFDSWLSVAGLMIPITVAVMHRIRHEESVLVGALGPAYSTYCARTKQLIPWVW